VIGRGSAMTMIGHRAHHLLLEHDLFYRIIFH